MSGICLAELHQLIEQLLHSISIIFDEVHVPLCIVIQFHSFE